MNSHDKAMKAKDAENKAAMKAMKEAHASAAEPEKGAIKKAMKAKAAAMKAMKERNEETERWLVKEWRAAKAATMH